MNKKQAEGLVTGYVRVSTDKQTVDNQRLAIHEYCNKNGLHVDRWTEVEAFSRKSIKQRRIDELLEQLKEGDTLIVSELSRLARSVGQIIMIIDELIKNKVRVVCIKENLSLNGKKDMQTKIIITMFSLFAEIERDLISERTKEGLRRARAEGKLLGRPKGSIGNSKLTGKEQEIKDYMAKGVNLTNIARIYNVAYGTLKHFVDTRGLA